MLSEEQKEECRKQGRQLAAFLLNCEPEQRQLTIEAVKEAICVNCYEPNDKGGVCHCTNDE